MDNKVKILIFIFITLLTISSLSHLTQNAFAESNYQDDEDVEATLHSTLVSDSSEIHSSLMPIGSYSFFETPELDVGSFSHDLTMIDVAKLQFPEFNATTSQSYSFVEGVNATQGNHTIYFNQELPEYTTSGGFDTIIYLNFNYSSSDYQIDTIFYDDFSSYGYWDLYNVSNRIFVSNDYPTGDAMVASNNPDHPYGGWYCLTVDSSGYWSYFSYVSDYLDANFSASLPNTKFYLTKESAPTGMTHSIYQTSKFYESNITWNNKPAVGDLISSEFISGGAGSKWLLDLETSIRYYYYVFKTTGGQLRWYAKDGNPANKKPLVHQYFYKNYQNDSLIYMQTNETETLSLISPDYGDIELVNKDNITIQCQSTSDHQLNLELSNAGNVIKTLEVIPEGNTEFGNQTIQFMINESLIFDQLKFTGVFDNKEYFKCYDINITGYRRQNFEHVYAEEFFYTVLGITYNDTIELSFDEYKSDYYGITKGTYFYYFDSSSLTHRQYTDDVIVNNQNLTIIIDLLETLEMTLDFTINASYSTTSWRVPTEVSLTINSQSVIDLTYNSGYVYLSTFPTTLSITADSNIFFELNLTSYFTFTFDLEIISKTYLRKTFKLLSDHAIYIETIALDSDLDIKKIYLNNDDLGSSNPNHLIPPVQMDTDNIFNLEIILAEELYRNLPYDNSRELYDEDWSGWNLGYDSEDTISSYNDGNLSSQLAEGHYPGTYSFKEEVGKEGLDIGFVDGVTLPDTTSCDIITELDNQKSVLRLSHAGVGNPSVVHNFPGGAEITGTREFWWASSDAVNRQNVYFRDVTYNAGIRLTIKWDKIYHHTNGVEAETGVVPLDNTFYHIKIVYDCSAGVKGEYTLYIDGIQIGGIHEMYQSVDNFNHILLLVNTPAVYSTYIDAFGSDKDPNYKIGDNLFYENYMGTHDFENYDLSTNANYYGEHGFDFETEQGYYKGSGGFNYEPPGAIATADDNEWITILVLPNASTCEILAELDNHKNVLKLTDDGAGGEAVAFHTTPSQTTGTIEWYIGSSDVTKITRWTLGEGFTNKIIIEIRNSLIQHIPNTIITSTGVVPVNDTLNHIRVTFDCNAGVNGQYQLYVDGNQIGGDHETMAATTVITSHLVATLSVAAYSSYIAAPGMVGETDPEGYVYEPTWNINEYNIDKMLDAGYELGFAFGDSHIKINSSVDGHDNVIELYDNQDDSLAFGEYLIFYIPFGSNKEYGTAEFWMRSSDATYLNQMTLFDGATSLFTFVIDEDKFKYYNGAWNDVGVGVSDDTWYHIRIAFECTAGSYESLAQYDWKIWINGTEYGDYDMWNNRAHADSIDFRTPKDDNGYTFYIDAVDFSWSDNYVSYRNTNQFYEDLVATNFDDDFTLTYAPDCYIMVNGTFDAYKKYLEIFDGNIANPKIVNTFADQTTGYIEFYWKSNDTSIQSQFFIWDGSKTPITIVFYIDKLKYYDSGWNDIQSVSDNVWYHLTIKFDSTSDKWSLWVDGVLKLDDIPYRTDYGSIGDIDSIEFSSVSSGSTHYKFFIDSLSYSWEDPIGINLLKEMPEIDNPYTTINKTISSTDLELYSYTVIISFNYKFTHHGTYLNTTKMNDVELIDDNTYHIYSTTITTSQHSFFYTFNISNGILLLSDFNFVIENQHSIQKTINPITTIDSVEFKEYLQADRTFEYWYYRNIYTINNLEIEHDPSSIITSSFGYENYKYYFSQYANTDDEFTGTIDYNPNWQISFTFIVNNATYSKVKVDYGADFVIYNTTLVLDLRNSGIFDDIENPNRDNYVLNIESLSFSSTTQSLYIIGNRTQQTPNPQTDVDLVQLNEEFTYNSQVLSSSYVSVNPNWQISTSVIDKNGTYGKLEIDYKADLPLINVDLKTSVKRNNMFSDVVETKDYQNDTSIYFQLDGLSFTTDYQSTYVEGFRTLLESDITTDDIYLDYNEEYKWSSTSLSNYTVGLCPCWLVSTSVLENNGTYGKVQVDFKADLSLINVDLKFSILRNVIFGDSIEIKGYQNTTEINFILENINFTTSLQSEIVEGFRILVEEPITTNDIYLDYNEEYKWSSISLSNYSIEIKPNWDVSFSYVINNASYSYIQSDYSSDLDFYNVTMNLDLRNTAIFDDMDNQGKDDYLLTIEYLNFTTSTKTLYITGTRTQYTSNPQTDINIIQLNETITYNSEILTTSLVDNDPNWQISISVIQKNATYGKLKVEYRSDATYTNVDLKTSITRNNMFDDSVEVKGYQNETTLSFELSAITFNSSFQITYIEGFRYLDEIEIHTNMSYVDYEERHYWSSVSLNNYSIEINPNWVILSSIVEYNGTYSEIKIQYKSDIAINNVTLQFSRSRNSIFGDIYELAGYQNITKIEFNLQNINFTIDPQFIYVEGFRSLTQINPTTNMTYLDFNEEYKWGISSLSNHSIRINPHWNINYDILSNNGTFAQLNISYYSDLCFSNVLFKLNLKYDDLYAENWSNNAQQSIYTYILEIPNINFTTSEQILNLTGVSSVPYCNFSSFINEDGFKLSDEEWRIKITDEEWRTITKSNWEDIEVYMYGYVQFTKYSRVFIISDMEDDWELDGVHYQGIPYDISATGYFTCEGWGSGITSAYLRFKTNPIENLRREQTRGQVIYKIKSKFDLKKVDFIFYIEENERYNRGDMIKQLKKEIDCTDIIEYYSIEDRIYYKIMDMDLDEGSNKITIYYKIENAAKYAWAGIIVGIAMIGFGIVYVSYRYKDNKIIDFIGLDKIVKYFFWIKKSERIKMTKKYRLEKRKKKRGKK